MNPIRSATLGVRDLGTAVARYAATFDYRLVERGTIDRELALSFDSPLEEGRHYAVMRPASGVLTDIRLIETAEAEPFRPLRTYGWAAIEICVQDVLAVHQRMQASDVTIIGPPSAIPTLTTIHPMQVQGADGDVVFLTEIKPGGQADGLPTALAPIDSLFICVLACRDMEAMAGWVASQLGAMMSDVFEIPYKTLSNAFGFPLERKHRIMTALRDGHLFIELDQYPPEAAERDQTPGRLPPGVSAVTLWAADLDVVPGPWLTPPRVRDGAVYEGRRVGVLRSPEGALVELVEGPGR